MWQNRINSANIFNIQSFWSTVCEYKRPTMWHFSFYCPKSIDFQKSMANKTIAKVSKCNQIWVFTTKRCFRSACATLRQFRVTNEEKNQKQFEKTCVAVYKVSQVFESHSQKKHPKKSVQNGKQEELDQRLFKQFLQKFRSFTCGNEVTIFDNFGQNGKKMLRFQIRKKLSNTCRNAEKICPDNHVSKLILLKSITIIFETQQKSFEF